MSDIVERLRDYTGSDGYKRVLCKEAADEIARLRAALKKLIERLDFVHEDPAYLSVWTVNQFHVGPYQGPTYVDELEAARRALEGEMMCEEPKERRDELRAAAKECRERRDYIKGLVKDALREVLQEERRASQGLPRHTLKEK